MAPVVLLTLLVLFEAWYNSLSVPKRGANEIQELCCSKFQGITVPEYADRESDHLIYSSDLYYLFRVTKDFLNSLSLTQVANGGRCAVNIDIVHLIGTNAGIFKRTLHHQ